MGFRRLRSEYWRTGGDKHSCLCGSNPGLARASARLTRTSHERAILGSKHARYYWLLLAEGHLNRKLFGAMLGRIWALPVPGR